VQDLQLDISMGGMAVAAVSVVSSGLQQIFVRTMQQKHKLSAHELLSNTAPAQVGACSGCMRVQETRVVMGSGGVLLMFAYGMTVWQLPRGQPQGPRLQAGRLRRVRMVPLRRLLPLAPVRTAAALCCYAGSPRRPGRCCSLGP
jgi:hypothetical protein